MRRPLLEKSQAVISDNNSLLYLRYRFWKSSFSESVLELPGVNAGFTSGLQLMHTAASMKPEERRYIPKPSLDIKPPPVVRPGTQAKASKADASNLLPDEEVPFRTVVEEYVAEHNLLFLPLGRAHHVTRLPLFRIAQNIDGKGGVTIYIMDDITWALPVGGLEEELFKPASLTDLVVRASKK